jgi:FemAB-related protein (PEP-CTERM system-associated)
LISPSLRPEWLSILHEGLGHEPYCLVASRGGRPEGFLPLALVKSQLFGRFLVGLPYLNVGGIYAEDSLTAAALLDRAIVLADELDVRYLELRHEQKWSHAGLTQELTSKVHMRLELPQSTEELWSSLPSKLRSQVRKASKNGVAVQWGGHELLGEFYRIFCHNMRDLGTPVYPRRLFDRILRYLAEGAEICLARYEGRAVAAGLLLHGRGITEVPSASSLRASNHLNGNMLLYWHLLARAIERGQRLFDFGRSSEESTTFRFKQQWGATPQPAVWQYYIRHGGIADMRPDSTSNQRKIALWRKMPVWLTRLIGPSIVRGIP